MISCFLPEGRCPDRYNAITDTFCKVLRAQLASDNDQKTIQKATVKLFEYIEVYSDTEGLNSSLNL